MKKMCTTTKEVFRIQLEAKEIQLVFPFDMILSCLITLQVATFVFSNDYVSLLLKPSERWGSKTMLYEGKGPGS